MKASLGDGDFHLNCGSLPCFLRCALISGLGWSLPFTSSRCLVKINPPSRGQAFLDAYLEALASEGQILIADLPNDSMKQWFVDAESLTGKFRR